MRDTPPPTNDYYEPRLYEIHISGHLDDQWADWFGDLTLTLDDNGNTRLTGLVVDQAALHGILRKVRNLGVSLLSVNQVKSEKSDTSGGK